MRQKSPTDVNEEIASFGKKAAAKIQCNNSQKIMDNIHELSKHTWDHTRYQI